jgi:hypothetical protein
VTWGALAGAVDAAARVPVPELEPMAVVQAPRGSAFALDLGATGSLLRILTNSQASTVTRFLGLTIPAMRTAHTVITKTPGTWPLRAWYRDQLLPVQPAWMSNPDPGTTWGGLIAQTLDDAMWYDRAHWRVTRRGADGYPLAFQRVPAADCTDDGVQVLVKGKTPRDAFPDDPGPRILADGRILESFLTFRWEGMGGLQGAGSVVVDLALALLSAASNYANAPVPQTTLELDASAGLLGDDEITAMLDKYEAARRERGTAYIQGGKLTHNGWSARELQLVEAREHTALEIARAVSLPASAVEASNGASLQYSTTVENRRERVEALRLWMAPVDQLLSLHALPRGVDARPDVTSYLRDDVTTRMGAWAVAIDKGILTLPEIRSQEPLATGQVTP